MTTARYSAYKSETRIVRLRENRVSGLEDELGEKDLVFAFVDLHIVIDKCNQCI